MSPDVIVYVCANCVPAGGQIPVQWVEDDVHVVVREVPCSGKMDVQYLLHAFEGGSRGICAVACPRGTCQLGQGNYRAEIRVAMVRRLIEEIGLEPGRAELIHCAADDPPARLKQLVSEAVQRIRALGESPLEAATSQKEGSR